MANGDERADLMAADRLRLEAHDLPIKHRLAVELDVVFSAPHIPEESGLSPELRGAEAPDLLIRRAPWERQESDRCIVGYAEVIHMSE